MHERVKKYEKPVKLGFHDGSVSFKKYETPVKLGFHDGSI